MIEVKTKICSKCKILKEVFEFNKHKNKRGGLDSWCKLCCEEYREKNKEKILKQKKEFLKKYPWKKCFYDAKDRCNNSKNKSYKNYGGRGIKCLITEEEVKFLWFRDKAWLLKKPSIDREDNDSNYCLNNCRFIELSENSVKRHIDNSQYRSILQYDLKGNFIKKWRSIKEAGEELEVNKGHISSCARGRRKTCGNFIWKYKELN